MTGTEPGSVSPQEVADNYGLAIASDAWRQRGIIRRDALAPLTGGGVGVDACLRVAEALGRCQNIETQYDEELLEELRAAEERGEPGRFEDVYLGPWQKEDLTFLASHAYAALQGPRQTEGKTWTISVIGTTYTGAGWPAILGMPTLTQGSRIIFLRVKQNLARLAVTFPDLAIHPKLDVDNQQEFTLNAIGGRMLVRTMDQDANNEGYSCALFIGDEMHKVPLKVLNVFVPMIRRYRRMGIGKVILSGIGGPPASSIEAVQDMEPTADHPGYKSLRRDGEAMTRLYPWLQPVQDEMLATLGREGYNQHWRCQRVLAGTMPIYRSLPETLEFEDHAVRAELCFIHDVGESEDHTYIIAFAFQGEAAQAIASTRIEHGNLEDQADQAALWMRGIIKANRHLTYTDENCIVEGNFGRKYLERLQHTIGFAGAYAIFTSDKPTGKGRKTGWINSSRRRAQEGNLAIGPACGQLRRALLELNFDISGTGARVWPHSDELSCMWLFEASRMGAFPA